MSSTYVARFFDTFLPMFKKDHLWQAMLATVEDSPWHREANTAVHTEMMLRWYRDNLSHKRPDRLQLITLLSITFHDVGKPAVQEVKTRADGTVYRSYANHEHQSANMWVNYALSNPQVTQLFDLSLEDIAAIAFILEFHLPYKIEKPKKVKAVQDTLMARLGQYKRICFIDLLMSDQHGRISDDHAEKIEATEKWIAEFTRSW